MAHEPAKGKGPGRRAFRPTIDGRLETRMLLSRMAPIRTQVAAGGQATVVTNSDGERFFISVVNGGTVRAFPAAGGRVNLVVDGSTVDTLLEINQVVPNHSIKRGAHSFDTDLQTQFSRINIASITVTSGTIGAIEGYRDAILSGPIVVRGPNRVDRIAFESIAPGGSIAVGGDLNTLDVLNEANFNRSAGVFVGRDLNAFNVGGNLSFSSGANFFVARDSGLAAQTAKGTGPAGQGVTVSGNLNVAPGSGFAIGRFLDGFLIINGNFSGASRTLIGGLTIPVYREVNASIGFNNIFIRGATSP